VPFPNDTWGKGRTYDDGNDDGNGDGISSGSGSGIRNDKNKDKIKPLLTHSEYEYYSTTGRYMLLHGWKNISNSKSESKSKSDPNSDSILFEQIQVLWVQVLWVQVLWVLP